MKILTITLGLTTIMLGVLTYVNYKRVDSRNEVVADREQTITNYKKVIDAIGRASDIDAEKLKTELKKDFNISEEVGYYEQNNEFYYVLLPKNNDINTIEIWDFMGLELILDNNKTFKSLNLHKP